MRRSFVGVLTATVIGVAGAASPAWGVPHSNATGLSESAVCGAVGARFAHCDARIVTDRSGEPLEGRPTSASAATTPAGYWPADLQSAYNLNPASGGTGQTIGIVDAFDDPNAESDLATYRSQFGLGPCTSASGCFKKVNQNGFRFFYPRGDSGWGEEISLDLDMASAICPNCKILLVEARTNGFGNLTAAEDTAARLGATTISNSYGGPEFSFDALYESHYNHPGVTVSTGDNGYRVEFPASSQYVTAVGGTSLTRDLSSRGWSETAWGSAGSGCSRFVSKPSWQTDGGCPRRTVADVSAVADPNTGVAVYDTFGNSGWLVFGGTSVASPIIAGVYALAGNSAVTTAGSYPYSHTSSLFDVTSGSNGLCGGSYLCTALPGYDGPTGLGSPNGTSAF